MAQKLLWHQQAKIPVAENLRPDLGPGLNVVLGKMMAKRVEDRYQKPAEVAEAIESARRIAQSRPVDTQVSPEPAADALQPTKTFPADGPVQSKVPPKPPEKLRV